MLNNEPIEIANLLTLLESALLNGRHFKFASDDPGIVYRAKALAQETGATWDEMIDESSGTQSLLFHPAGWEYSINFA